MMAPRRSMQAIAKRPMEYGETATAVHHLLEAQAARTPQATALAFNQQSLSYVELNQRADAFADKLIGLGVGPESLVAISSERSPEQLIALLGTLKAGAAYAPVDPAYPDDRLTAILEDARPVVLVTQAHLMPRLASFEGPVIYLDAEDGVDTAKPLPPRHGAVDAGQAAYVIFTSGSTGKPKGVLIEHRSLSNHATAMARHYELGPGDRVLQFASLSFDVAAEEIYPTWLSGGSVVLWPINTGVAPLRYFIQFVEEQSITVLNLPAPYWHEWVNELVHVGIPSSVRLVITGSDKVSSEKFSVWRKYAGSRVRFCAAYGPTEGTITATVFDPSPDYAPTTPCLPIGKPIDNAETYVLDSAFAKVADGESGELFIGGAGLARGYLHQPELTAERFLRNPFSQAPDARLYRTGDLARRLPDGNLEFLGRLDDQLKIRGFRIEVGEIENVLRQHPAARSVFVTGRDDAGGEKKLVAYVVVTNDNRPTTDDLRSYLKARLPEYMVPSAFVMLKSFPLTPGGKIDRRQLPPPEIERNEPDKQYIAPRTETERQLVRIWETMLDVRPVGIRDNFFELGGHSLLDARLVAEVERGLGVTLPLATIYHTRTIENLAETVERKKSARPDSLLQPFRTQGTKPPIFSQGGSTHLAEHLGQDQPIYWLDHHGTSGFAIPNTIEAMAANYVKEIREVQPRGPYYLLGYCIGGVLMLEVARYLRAQGATIGLLCLIGPITPRNLIVARAAGTVKSAPAADSCVGRPVAWLKKLPRRIRSRYYWANRIGKRVLCDLWIRCGHRLPVYWRDFYCDEKLSQAIARYEPSTYPGSFIIFRQPNNGTEAGWRSLAHGSVDFHDTWVDHNELLEEPYVQILAGKLKSCLHQAQSMQSARHNAAGIPGKPAHEPKLVRAGVQQTS